MDLIQWIRPEHAVYLPSLPLSPVSKRFIRKLSLPLFNISSVSGKLQTFLRCSLSLCLSVWQLTTVHATNSGRLPSAISVILYYRKLHSLSVCHPVFSLKTRLQTILQNRLKNSLQISLISKGELFMDNPPQLLGSDWSSDWSQDWLQTSLQPELT